MRTDYLQALGIPVWRHRDTPRASAQPSQESTSTLVRVVVEHPTDITIGQGDIGIMLGKLLQAMRLDGNDYKLECIRQADQFHRSSAATLAFVKGIRSEGRLLGLPTAQRMLDDREQKKIAWDRLKPWVGKLA